MLSLIIFLMVGWYVVSIRTKLQRWEEEEAMARSSKQQVKPVPNEEHVDEDGFVLDEDSELWFHFPRGGGLQPLSLLLNGTVWTKSF